MGQLIVRPTLPLRLMGLGARSAFETVGYGLRPFDVTDAPVDVVTLTRFGERTVERSGFCVADPGVDDQILSGIFPRENPQWRWAEKKSEFLLNAPRGTYRLRADGSVPDAAPGRFVELSMNGKSVASVRLQRPGEFVIESKDVTTEGGSARIELSVDSDFSPGGGDRRRLAMIVKCVEFVPSPPQPAQSTPLKR
jgi:hypothetical protein